MSAEDLFGELYLLSTRPFLTEAVTRVEAEFIAGRLREGPTLDLGCGHGRHLAQLPGAVGVDRDPLSLAEARRVAPVVRGDFAALPFRSGALGNVVCWYNTLGTVEVQVAARFVAEVARCLSPGGQLIAHSDHPWRAVSQPTASYEGHLPGGAYLSETSAYDGESGKDTIRRTLTLPDGRVMAATFFIRYYDVAGWSALLGAAGLEVGWSCGGVDGTPVGSSSRDVIVGAHKT